MESKLNVLQRRSTGAKCVALCPAMDLVALLTEDGQLSVHRTLSWERILHKGVEDVDDEWGLPTSLTFSPSGNLLALGHVTGQVSIINLENGIATRAYDCSKLMTQGLEMDRIERVHWVLRPISNEQQSKSCGEQEMRLAAVSGISNVFQGLKASTVNAADISLDTAPSFSISASAMPGSMLYATSGSGVVIAFVAGVFPLFAVRERSHNSGGGGGSTTLLPLLSFSPQSPLRGTEKALFGHGPGSLNTFLSSLHNEEVVCAPCPLPSSLYSLSLYPLISANTHLFPSIPPPPLYPPPHLYSPLSIGAPNNEN